MKTSIISTLFFITILFSACLFDPDVRFIEAQPEHLEELSCIPNKFQGRFVINNDTVIVTDCTIKGDTINSDALVVKGWGNYLFVNSLENGVYKLGCAKVVNAWNNENISLEYFLGESLMFTNTELEAIEEAPSQYERYIMERIDKMIADKNNPLIRIDSTDGPYHYILDNVSINQFQSLLNNARSKEVTRIE